LPRINLEFNSLLFYIPRDFAVRLPPHFGHGLERYFKMRIDLSMDPFFSSVDIHTIDIAIYVEIVFPVLKLSLVWLKIDMIMRQWFFFSSFGVFWIIAGLFN